MRQSENEKHDTAIDTRSQGEVAKLERQIVLSARDLALFEWIAEHRFSTKALLIERFYSAPTRMRPGAAKSGEYAASRLKQLERAGHLSRSRYRVLNESPLLLSEQGYALLHGRERSLSFRAVPDIDIENYEHDVWVQRLRIAFEREYRCSRWTTERALRSTPKRADRLKELLAARANASKSSAVLYILDRRFADFYREIMAVTVNPSAFHITYFDQLTHAGVGGDGWVKRPLAQLFGTKETAS